MNGIRTLRNITRTYRHVKRYRQIFNIIMKNGFGYIFSDLKLYMPGKMGFLSSRNLESRQIAESKLAERFRATLVELGPTFVKLGQFLSTRPDILSNEMIEALSTLREKVPPFPFQDVQAIIRQELDGEIEDLFQEFSDKPAGSASIAQGYKARLKDGTRVFVKVQRPNIMNVIKVDLEILSYLALHLEENVPEMALFKPTKLVEDFADSLLKELDFHNEAANMLAFGRQFAMEEELVVPRPFSKYSTSKVLTMTYIEGIHATNPEKLRKAGMDIRHVGELGVKLLLAQFFDHGFFHGDPHSGNMFVLPGSKIAYIDFGVMGRLTEGDRNIIKKLVTMMYMDNYREMTKCILAMSELPDNVDADGLERDIASMVASHFHGNVEDLSMMDFTRDFYRLCYRRKLCLRPHFYSMIRALSYADAMGRELVPDFNIYRQLHPYMLRQSIERLNPVKHVKGTLELANDWIELAKMFPGAAETIIKMLKEGRLKVNHQIEDVSKLAKVMDNSLRNLAAGLVVAASLVSGALMLLARIPPLICDVSVLGFATFAVSATIGLIMLIKNAR